MAGMRRWTETVGRSRQRRGRRCGSGPCGVRRRRRVRGRRFPEEADRWQGARRVDATVGLAVEDAVHGGIRVVEQADEVWARRCRQRHGGCHPIGRRRSESDLMTRSADANGRRRESACACRDVKRSRRDIGERDGALRARDCNARHGDWIGRNQLDDRVRQRLARRGDHPSPQRRRRERLQHDIVGKPFDNFPLARDSSGSGPSDRWTRWSRRSRTGP